MSQNELHSGIPADFRYAIQFSPASQRDALTALGNLCFGICDVLRTCSDPGVAETKLRWWEEEIELMLEDKARHPDSQAFWDWHGKLDLTNELFLDIINSTRLDLQLPGFATFNDVMRYCRQRGGSLTALAAGLCGADSFITLAAARNLGRAWQLADIVTRSASDARLGRVYFAVEDLRRHQVDKHVVDGRHTDAGLKTLLAEYADRARALVQESLAAVPALDRDALVAGAVLAGLAQARLDRLARRHFISGDKPVELPPFVSLWVAWRSARRTRLPESA